MKRVLITGMSGQARARCCTNHRPRLPDRRYRLRRLLPDHHGESLWREDRIRALLSSAPDELLGVLFVQGTTRNQVLFYARFDHIVLLSAPPEVPTERLATRATKPEVAQSIPLRQLSAWI